MKKKRLVMKLGTFVVLEEEGAWNSKSMGPALEAALEWKAAGHDLLIVSSGAVGLGRRHLKMSTEASLVDRQVCAAIGQTELMNFYRSSFEKESYQTAQVLLSVWDLMHRSSYLRLSACLEAMWARSIIPIINENDCVSVTELKEHDKSFGDNDKLSAIVAAKLNADALLILSRLDGLVKGSQKVNRIRSLKELKSIDEDPSLPAGEGRGGLQSKLEAAALAAMSGVKVVIGSGQVKIPPLLELFDSPEKFNYGTFVDPVQSLSEKKRWVASSSLSGAIWINEGALQALFERGASVLPVGIVRTEGDFRFGQVVHVFDEAGQEWARGVTRMSVSDLRSKMGQKNAGEFIHRDELVILGDHDEWKSRSEI